jgi:hypothetical protein
MDSRTKIKLTKKQLEKLPGKSFRSCRDKFDEETIKNIEAES